MFNPDKSQLASYNAAPILLLSKFVSVIAWLQFTLLMQLRDKQTINSIQHHEEVTTDVSYMFKRLTVLSFYVSEGIFLNAWLKKERSHKFSTFHDRYAIQVKSPKIIKSNMTCYALQLALQHRSRSDLKTKPLKGWHQKLGEKFYLKSI